MGNTYSVVITWTKIILPIVALGLLSTLFLFADQPNPEDAIIFADVDIAELARQQRLTQPRFAGTLPGGREILFQAEIAAPSEDRPGDFEASGVSVRVELSQEEFAILDADRATIDLTEQLATLSGGVDLRRSDGMQLTTENIKISLDRLHAESETPVLAQGSGLTIRAGGMTLSDENGPQLLHFINDVEVIYAPESVEE